MLNKYLIVVAGGVGSRMNATIPKQFLLVNGKPILFHTIENFACAIPELRIICVLHPDYFDLFEELKLKHDFNCEVTLVEGGKTRYHSSKNGINAIDGEGIIAIHDAARPIVSKQHIIDLFQKAELSGFVLPVVSLKESLRLINGESSENVDRSTYKVVQTPQLFKSDRLKEAFEKGYKSMYTDDASVVQSELGISPLLVEGEENNIKITTPIDMVIAQQLL